MKTFKRTIYNINLSAEENSVLYEAADIIKEIIINATDEETIGFKLDNNKSYSLGEFEDCIEMLKSMKNLESF